MQKKKQKKFEHEGTGGEEQRTVNSGRSERGGKHSEVYASCEYWYQ